MRNSTSSQAPLHSTQASSALNRLRSEKRLQVVAVGGALLALGFFMDFGESGKLWGLLGDGLHTPIFCCVTIGAWWFFGETRTALLMTAALTTALVVGVELIQPFTGRSASWVDVVNGLIGIASGALFASAAMTGRQRASLLSLPFILLGSAAAFSPALHEYRLLQWRHQRLPMLSDFESPNDRLLWKPISEDRATESLRIEPSPERPGAALRIRTIPLQYSGSIFRLESMDWTSYSELSLSVYLDSPATVSIRIDDWQDCEEFENRFNRLYSLPEGWSDLHVSMADIRNGRREGRLDVSSLRRLLIFLDPSQRAQDFWVDRIKLSK